MADAAWLVNGCNVRHFGCLAKVQLQWYHGATMREASVAVERLSSSVGCIPSLSPNRASSRVAGTFELRTSNLGNSGRVDRHSRKHVPATIMARKPNPRQLRTR
jgi:hypothetical protein